MTSKVSHKDSLWYKTGRISFFGLAGSAIGTALAGPLGGLSGFLVSTGVSLGVSLLDGLMLDQLGKQANPRRFSTDFLSPLLAKQQLNQANSLKK